MEEKGGLGGKVAAEIRRKAGDLVWHIRLSCIEQKDLWQKVPYLALQADGRSGYHDQYNTAYRLGCWIIQSSLWQGHYHVYVDLETGELFNSPNLGTKAFDDKILIAARSPEQFDAEYVVKELTKQSRKMINIIYDPAEQRRWRKQVKKECGLEKDRYQREPKKEWRRVR
jgi:hypothetical protein